METLSVLLVQCEGNLPVIVVFFDVSEKKYS